MSGTINKVMLIGHTGDAVKMTYFEGGGCLGRVPLATNESWTDKNTGEKKSVTDWHNIVLRNKQAETFEKYVQKGHKVYVEGKLKTRKWTDDKGIDRYSTEVNVLSFTFLQPKQSQGSVVDAYENKSALPQQPQQQNINPEPLGSNDHDDLPF